MKISNLIFAFLILPCFLFAIDWETIPDMTWVSISMSGGPHLGRGEFTTTYDHINNVWINGFGCTSPCYSSDTYEYSPETNTWQTTFPHYCRGSSPGDRPGGRCSGGSAFSEKDTIALYFAWANVGSPPDLWLYSATRNKWTSKGRHSLGGGYEALRVVYDGPTDGFYCFDAHGNHNMYRYTIRTNQWTKAQTNQGPATRDETYYCYGMAISESRRIILVVTTGTGGDWIYKIDTATWIKLNSNHSIHGPRYRAGLVYDIANDVFLLLGNKGAGHDMFALTLNSDNTSGTWTEITNQVKGITLPTRGESFTYDRTHNVSFINESCSGGGCSQRAAFRYKKGTTIQNPQLISRDAPLLDCYPNPFRPSATIMVSGSLKQAKIGIYDPAGMLIKTLNYSPNQSHILWYGKDNYGCPVGAGTYFIKLESADKKAVKRIILKQ
jgi:hypothetical protein